MVQSIAQFALVVQEYDEAIDFYTRVLKFDLLEDTKLSEIKRWVRIRPKGSEGCGILLAKAKDELERSRIGNQTGGRVFLFLHTDDILRDLENLKKNEVDIIRPISEEDFGKVLVFADLYGNLWDLIQPVS